MDELVSVMSKLNADKIITGVVILAVSLVAIHYIMKLLHNMFSGLKNLNATLIPFLERGLRYFLYFLAVMFATNAMGIPITSFVALFSVVGLAVSLAVQNVLGNLAGGVVILVSKPFAVGDMVETNELTGTVLEIAMLHTRMKMVDGRTAFVPNSVLYSNKLINYTGAGRRRVDLSVSASYDNSPEEVRKAVMDAVNSIPEILQDPAPTVRLESYDANDIAYSVLVWAKASDFANVKYRLNESLYGSFKRNGVEMSYPHVNVHMQ